MDGTHEDRQGVTVRTGWAGEKGGTIGLFSVFCVVR